MAIASTSNTPSSPDSIDLYDRLSKAPAHERNGILLEAVDTQTEHHLSLPARDGVGAALASIDLRAQTVEGMVAGDHAPIWWDKRGRRVTLRKVNLEGADLRHARLEGIDLQGANLQHARLGETQLQGAALDQAQLQHADLAGADLSNATLGEANLEGAFLEDAVLRDVSLRYANLTSAVLEEADLRRADLWGARLDRAALTGTDLRDAMLIEIGAEAADLSDTKLSGATIEKAKLQGANLRGVDLEGASLVRSDLTAADLSNAKLQGVVLSDSTITHVRLGGAWLDKTRLQREQLGDAVGEELAGEYSGAARAYLALEQNFLQLGDPDAASWAYLKKRRMQKLDAREQAGAALRQRRLPTAAGRLLQYLADQLVEWVCDYGESIPRVLLSIVVVSLLFTILYGVTGSVMHVGGRPANAFDLITFTLLAMTSQVPMGLQVRSEHVLLLSGTQTLLSVFLVGLLGFVAGNRIRR